MRRLVLPAVMALMAGCDSTTPELEVPGTYALRTVEGRALPTPAGNDDGYVVVGGVLVLTEDGLYRDSVAVRAMDGSWTSFYLADGSYMLEGAELTLNPPWGTPPCTGRIDHGGYTCASPHGRLLWVRM